MGTTVTLEGIISTLTTLNSPLTHYLKTAPVTQPINDVQIWEFSQDTHSALIGLSGEASFHVLNSADDISRDPVVSLADSVAQDGHLRRPLTFNPELAHCLYTLSATGKGTGTSTFKQAGFGFDITAGLSLATYTCHPTETLLKDALLRDTQRLPIVLSVNDILSLEHNSAVTLTASGSLSLGVNVSWSDIITDSLQTLSSLVGDDALLLKVSAGASVDFSYAIGGGFTVIFARQPNSQSLHLGLTLASQSELSAGVELSIQAEFSDPGRAAGFVQSHLDDLFKVSDKLQNKIDGVIARIENTTNEADLPSEIKDYLPILKEKLGLDTALSTYQDLQGKLADIKSSMAKTITDNARKKARIAFSYQFNRLMQNDYLLEASLPIDEAFMQALHAKAIRGNFDGVLDIINQHESATIERFLSREVTTTQSKWGFTLSFGTASMFGRDRQETKHIVIKNALGEQKVTFDAQRGYRFEYNGEEGDWYLDFDAHMPSFSASKPLRMREFEFALTVAKINSLGSVNELDTVIDQALTWGVLHKDTQDHDQHALLDVLKEKLSGASNINVECKTEVPSDVFQLFADKVASQSRSDLSKALARALCFDSSLSTRVSPEQREKVYAELMLGVLDNHNTLYFGWQKIRAMMSKYGGIVREAEGSKHAKDEPNTFLYAMHKHRQLPEHLQNMQAGFAMLAKAPHSNQSAASIPDVYAMFDDMGAQGFFVRFIGSLAALSCSGHALLSSRVSRSISFSYKDDNGQAQTLQLSDAIQ